MEIKSEKLFGIPIKYRVFFNESDTSVIKEKGYHYYPGFHTNPDGTSEVRYPIISVRGHLFARVIIPLVLGQ
ncbi:hypothetical protein A3A76_05880 [Candidatus Woesebacteria bacterium RIFCSPLOWO2_01_FULL_39_23]|uniref:Uncharacterized protein n=1 Tax=Candidatus Woesebacteria bacterium RIFCSPHIGHO2_01_FULL_40_22 TaxID=1802499 RepID=A0A1F7YHV8_9BACT|nr:MAG: hypothetical protein A2141_02580 [Candidatus Woesebacteria bacterium RBG_16_40_11]OGM26931.1 MAG: hypothetical protein A2628_05825 [Candidatus Woesebacteria bacterium RIFCSPHIGHO2_01_FULL_40_22]OGM37340.1 MAG: hypothetical protein A3E41_04220 [Candidatus Woesebacteria bacterium RIFCSPHIGHO2_12_FULL_38_9]OGM63205.1 MAG: hypothetical protein A3A76_05880 [Candidatus Woesebacteria bacterium RIFCSPLOWO2_01_FULL_39_23]